MPLMRENTLHLLRLWIPSAAIVVLVGAGFVYNLVQGDSTAYYAIGTTACLFAGIVLWTRRRVKAVFAEPTADKAIAFYRRQMEQMPEGKAMVAYHCALAAALYGDFDRAREELCRVNWSSLPPMYQGYESHIHSLFALFETHDYQKALEFAQEALDLCAVPSALPGADTAQRALSAHASVCRILLGIPTSQDRAELELAVDKLPGIGPAIPAWALAAHYHSAGDDGVAGKYMAISRRLLPNSPGLADYPFKRVLSSS